MSSIDTQGVPEVDLREFARVIGLEQIAPGRYSALLAANLLECALSGQQNPAKIVREIKLLESGKFSQFKKPIKNRYPPLKGLWHKHYMQDGLASFLMNVDKGFKWYGVPFFKQKAKEAEEAGELRYLTPEDVPALVDDIVSGNWQRLSKKRALSGEWIIFAKHEGQNYYLTITMHESSHQLVREQIDQVCCVEFPFLAQLLADA